MPEGSVLNIPSSPIAALGSITLLVAFVVAAYSAATGLIGNAQHRRKLVNSSIQSLYGFTALTVLASALMIYAFVTHDYTIKYVAATSDSTMPLWYKVTSYWGALEGSLMFWVAVLAVFSAVAVRANAERHRDMIGYVVAVVMIVQVFFLAILIYNKNPFATFLTEPPVDGKGLNPLLQTYWMVIHPPSLYTGFVAATIPFAFGIAALASGRLDDRWLASVRSWSLICFFFLSLGLILGGRWAYEELGWGGYWAWDPVENAGLIPWFTMTAFLHSIMIQEQRGMMKVWNLVLVILTFWLTIFGTFMTRSGVVQSVHAFGEDNELALFFILFMSFIFVASFGLLIHRLPKLRSQNRFESFISREFAFLLNNWVLLGCAVFVLFVTMFPTISEAVDGQRIQIGPEFFNKWMIPLGLVLLFLAGAAPLLAWRRSTQDRLWNQFAFPVAAAAVIMGAVALLLPRSLEMIDVMLALPKNLRLGKLSGYQLQLPMNLINFGFIGFVLASLGQEFYRGTRVRMKQSGSDAFTALIGLMVTKRRKHGGYIVHAGVALMFLGFAGNAYEVMEDRTVTLENRQFGVEELDMRYNVRNYQFEFKRFDEELRDGYVEYRATVELTGPDGEVWGTLQPSKRKYEKSDQPTTEVDLDWSPRQDVYMILTGFEKGPSGVSVVNFRIYINPLINWVWFGFIVLMFGTAICLLPKKWVDRGRGKTTAAVLALIALSLPAMPASAQSTEHSDSGHNVGAGVAHLFRANDPQLLAPYRGKAVEKVKAEHPDWDETSPEFRDAVAAELGPITGLARRLMTGMFCMCGGCNRETLHECRCGFAAQEREKLLALLGNYDLSTAEGRAQAEAGVIDAFVKRHGESVTSAEKTAQWVIPTLAVIGSLLLLFAVGRRWVKRGRDPDATSVDEEDEDYADLLDDELRETD